MDIECHRRVHAPTSPLHRWHVRSRRRSRNAVRVQAKQKKQKRQYGPGAGGAAEMDPALEAAYQQFGRALGEAPRETAKIVQQKLGIEQTTQQPISSQPRMAQRQRPQQRQIDDASFKKLERLFDMAMSDPLNDQDAQPQALLRAKARMAPSITEAQRRETLLELLENTLKPRKAAASLGMDLIEPVRPCGGQQVPKLMMPYGKTPAAERPSSSPAVSASTIPDLVMPRGKQATPVRPQSPGASSREPVAEPAPPRANLGPPPPLIQPKGRLEVQQATRLSNELDAMQRGTVPVRAPIVEVRISPNNAFVHCTAAHWRA
ncbi:g13510 [Coccomyxa viridis]|uniref:G13510 protein n=1 Tax=Coccomyxa viridis TaxID=1274662 RepID=A0ABP1GCY6_9CHLO